MKDNIQKINDNLEEWSNYKIFRQRLRQTLASVLAATTIISSASILPLKYAFKYYTVSLKHYSDNAEEEYNSLSKQKKIDYVKKIFSDTFDQSKSYQSLEVKEDVKKRVLNFLNDWGYLYDFDDVVKLESALSIVSIDEEDSIKKLNGYYTPYNGKISVIDLEDSGVLSHETTHAITTDPGLFLRQENTDFLFESITSSIDYYYGGDSSYFSMLRTHTLFLSEIFGLENMMKCYIKGDFSSLKDFLGKDNLDVLEFLHLEYEDFINNNNNLNLLSENEEYLETVAERLKKLYEDKTGKKINDDAIVYVIYQSCLPNNNFEINSTMFSKNLSYIKDYEFLLVDPQYRNYRINSNDDLYFLSYKSGDYSRMVGSMVKVFTEEKLEKILLSGNIRNYLENILSSMNLSNKNRVLDYFYQDNYQDWNNSESFSDDFLDDISVVYYDKFKNCIQTKNYLQILDDLESIAFNGTSKQQYRILERVSSRYLDEFHLDVNANDFILGILSNLSSELSIKNKNVLIKKLGSFLSEKNIQSMIENKNLVSSLKGYLEYVGLSDTDYLIYCLFSNSRVDLSDEKMENFYCLFYPKYKSMCEYGNFEYCFADLNNFCSLYLQDDAYKEEFINKLNRKLLEEDGISVSVSMYDGLYWFYKDHNDIDNSKLEFYKLYDKNEILLPDFGMEYMFYRNNDCIIIEPIYKEKQENGFIKCMFSKDDYDFQRDGSLCVAFACKNARAGLKCRDVDDSLFLNDLSDDELDHKITPHAYIYYKDLPSKKIENKHR